MKDDGSKPGARVSVSYGFDLTPSDGSQPPDSTDGRGTSVAGPGGGAEAA